MDTITIVQQISQAKTVADLVNQINAAQLQLTNAQTQLNALNLTQTQIDSMVNFYNQVIAI